MVSGMTEKERDEDRKGLQGVEGECRKVSIRFFNDREVRAVWDDGRNGWFFSVLDVVGVLNDQENYAKNRNYWKWLKAKLKREGNQLVSATTQLKLRAPDGKRRLSDVLDAQGVVELVKAFPNNKAAGLLDWFLYSDNTIDGRSKQKAYQLFESGLLESVEVGTAKGLRQIHAYLFGGLYDFAGQVREKNIAKGGFAFAQARFLPATLERIGAMPEGTFGEIVGKYVEMNVAHPFLEGNGRATRIWLDLMLKRALRQCVDWSRVDKTAYLDAMRRSVADSAPLEALLRPALTPQIDDRELFMKGIDYSYYYEEGE
jgi:cell filamentation protein